MISPDDSDGGGNGGGDYDVPGVVRSRSSKRSITLMAYNPDIVDPSSGGCYELAEDNV